MRVLFVSGEGIAADLARRLGQEGCEVKLFIQAKAQQQCLNGLVQKTGNWKQELSWVGKGGLIIFDDVGYGKLQDKLRHEGYRVFGGSLSGDKLEKDRAHADAILKRNKLSTVPLHDFKTSREALQFVEKHPGPWVVKQNTHQSALNYVGELKDNRDVLTVLEHYSQLKINNITLQKKLQGVEIGIARYFNGNDWVGPIEMNVEHKSLFPGNIGPKTGEMGTLMWYDPSESNRIFQTTLARLKPYLQSINFRGDIALALFVNKRRIFPIEFTARLGCPSTHLQGVLNISPWHEFLGAVADGRHYALKYHSRFGIVITLALPPFPYTGKLDTEYSSNGIEILFRNKLTKHEQRRIHFEGVSSTNNGQERYSVCPSLGYVLFVSGLGDTVEQARKSAYDLVEKVVIPKVFFRNDIGSEFTESGLLRLQEWGWL